MESVHLKMFTFLPIKKLKTDKMQNNFSLLVEYSGFIKST